MALLSQFVGANLGTAVIQATASPGTSINIPAAGWYSLSSLGLQTNYKNVILDMPSGFGNSRFTLKTGTYYSEFQMYGATNAGSTVGTMVPTIRNSATSQRIAKFTNGMYGEFYGHYNTNYPTSFTINQDTICDLNIYFSRDWAQYALNSGEYHVGAQLILTKIG